MQAQWDRSARQQGRGLIIVWFVCWSRGERKRKKEKRRIEINGEREDEHSKSYYGRHCMAVS